jgi:ribosomal protein S18 acetylase RimI-like enzyme
MTQKSPLQFAIKLSSGPTDDVCIVPMMSAMVPETARLHIEALADSRTASMGNAYVETFIEWFRQPDRGATALVAIDRHNHVVGYVIGARLGYARDLSKHLAWTAAAAVIARPWLFFKLQFRNGFIDRLQLLMNRSLPQVSQPELPEPTLSLVAIGVSPHARRKNIGLRLVQAFESKARELQMQSVRLSTDYANVAACRLYERCGWRPFPVSSGLTYYFRILDEHFGANDKR